ncbi:MAG: SusD/RagB family nutrient-binding outer membrane lipoprotein, partial [Candidatus Heimdallarchaeota archaeon]|nr:SusD/RagB family nutrient-binding outer membrane lipoprotein [Candidatus Heimdallarchaeota archaeon]
EYMYVLNEVIYKQTQQCALTYEAWGNFTLGTEDMWSKYYGALTEIRELERRFGELEDSPELDNMKAMLKIVHAYKAFKITDIFGDIPLFDAGYGFQSLDNLNPVFNSQEDIYKHLLDELKWADEHIDITATSEEPFHTFSSFDNLFNGNMETWQKLANSLRMRHAMRMVEKDADYAGVIIKEIIEENRPIFLGYDFITSILESGCLWPNGAGFYNGGPNWAFHEQKNLRLGKYIWDQMATNDNADGSGIFDPRAFIFFEPNNALEWNVYPQVADINTPAPGGIPYGYHRDDQSNADLYYLKGEGCIYSPVNYFLIRDGNNTPIIFITGAEIHFIKAEAYLRGIGVAQDATQADIEYMNGINSSVEWWIKTAENLQLPSSKSSFTDFVEIPSGLGPSSVLTHFGTWNATTDDEKLDFIYTQRWIDLFWQPWQAYALARRTGRTPRVGDDINHFRMPYPPSEVEFNQANWNQAMSNQGGGDTPEYKIWWIPDNY